MTVPPSAPITPARQADIAAAQQSMRLWQIGSASGDWSGLLARLAPDVTFCVPVTGFSGVQRGAAVAARFFDYISSVLRADLRVTSMLSNGASIGFEVHVSGTLLGEPFVQGLCIVFGIREGQVRSFHEYLAWPGGLDPAVQLPEDFGSTGDLSPLIDVFGHMDIHRLVPTVVLENDEQAAPVAEALVAGGLPIAEVTLRTESALEAIRAMAVNVRMLVGAGTVIRPSQVGEALDAGASFIVCPGFSASVVAECRRLAVPVIPGVATASEVQLVLDAGLRIAKFFPAEPAGGVATLSALSAPYRELRFVPTGGIGVENARAYLQLRSVLAVGGNWMVPARLLAVSDYEGISALVAEAVALVASLREPAGGR